MSERARQVLLVRCDVITPSELTPEQLFNANAPYIDLDDAAGVLGECEVKNEGLHRELLAAQHQHTEDVKLLNELAARILKLEQA